LKQLNAAKEQLTTLKRQRQDEVSQNERDLEMLRDSNESLEYTGEMLQNEVERLYNVLSQKQQRIEELETTKERAVPAVSNSSEELMVLRRLSAGTLS
jgi:chromosome segregation ATPase